ncbi:hypothetical protein ACU4GD_08560 [Cupriavidus basilensis]
MPHVIVEYTNNIRATTRVPATAARPSNDDADGAGRRVSDRRHPLARAWR